MTMVPVFCGRDCGGDACPLLAEVDEGRVLRIRHNPAAGEYVRGCPKGFALPHFHYSSERIKTPLVRSGPRGSGAFKSVSWDEALDRVRDGLLACAKRYGPQAVMSLSSAGSTGALHNTEKLTRRFLNAIGGCTVLDGNYSSNAAGFALRNAFGSDYANSGFDPATMDKSSMVILWGANILEARLAAELPARLLRASERGVPVISIDPRKTATTKRAKAEWIPVRPGTDAALMYAILDVLRRERLIDEQFVERRAEGFADLMDFVSGRLDGVEKSPAWAASLCGLEAEAIAALAKRWAEEKPVMLIPGYSIQRTEAGEEVARLCVALQLATGNFGIPGGSTGSLNNRLPGPRIGMLGEGDGSRNSHVPILRWADAILEGPPKYPSRVRAIYSAGGNFLNQGADIGKNIKAFATLDFAVSHELFLTPTAKYCDIILPAASPLQKEDVGLPWAGNYLLYKPQILPREGQERSDYSIFRDLAARFGVESVFSEGKSEEEWIDHFLESSEIPDIAEFKRKGVFFGTEQERSGLEAFAANPELYPLGTASGKIQLRGKRWEGWKKPPAHRDFPLLLITPKAAMRVHSQGGDHPDRIASNLLMMNKADAFDLRLNDGDMAEIVSPTGSTRAAIRGTNELMRGVVSLDEGTWCVASALGKAPMGSANYLSSTKGTEESISCIMHGIPVEVRKVEPVTSSGQ
ncbi:MAG: molybdopterin-containing oxidoreductase family protein [Spirochaetales bacterium]